MRRPWVAAILGLALCCTSAEPVYGEGRLDPGFGNEGIRLLPASFGEAGDAAMLPDGRTVIAGKSSLTALLADGRIDESFGVQGIAALPSSMGGSSSIHQVLVDSAGRPIAVGTFVSYGNGDPTTSIGEVRATARVLAARFTTNGEFDPTFGGGDGIALTDFGMPPALPGLPPEVLTRFSALDASDRILISGTRSAGTVRLKLGATAAGREAFIARLTAAGAVDQDFAAGGALRIPGFTYAGEPAVTASESIYFMAAGALRHLVLRLSSDGRSDPLFGEDGARTAPVESAFGPVLIDPAERVLLTGYLQGWRDHKLPNGILIRRMLGTGSLDRSFGRRGVAVLRLPRLYTVSLRLDRRGRILVALSLKRGRNARGPEALGLARLRPNGKLDPTFGRKGVIEVRFRGKPVVYLEELEVLGERALIRSTWCGRRGRCRPLLTRVGLGRVSANRVDDP